MKRKFAKILIYITFLIVYILQSNFFSWFTIAGVKPNIFIIFIVFLGLFGSKYMGVISGVIIGLLLDVFMGKNIGISAIMLGIVGILARFLNKNFSKDSKLTIILMIMTSTLVYELGGFIVNTIIFSYEVPVWNFVRIVLIEMLYNSMLTIIIYPFMQRVGFSLEDMYRENKILTRYF